MFDIIPALDLSRGRLARLTARGPAAVSTFGGDPLAAAAAFLEAGVTALHVVDLDLATEGVPRNLSLVGSLAALGVSVQASGGAATGSELEQLLGAGAHRVVLGSAALEDRVLVTGLIERLGDRLAIGIETDGDRIRSRGRRSVDLPLGETLAWLGQTAVGRFVVTGVRRVGELAGPDLEGLIAVVALGRPALGSGGVASLDDLRTIRDAGGAGAIVGRAALEGVLDLAAARRELEAGPSAEAADGPPVRRPADRP